MPLHIILIAGTSRRLRYSTHTRLIDICTITRPFQYFLAHNTLRHYRKIRRLYHKNTTLGFIVISPYKIPGKNTPNKAIHQYNFLDYLYWSIFFDSYANIIGYRISLIKRRYGVVTSTSLHLMIPPLCKSEYYIILDNNATRHITIADIHYASLAHIIALFYCAIIILIYLLRHVRFKFTMQWSHKERYFDIIDIYFDYILF